MRRCDILFLATMPSKVWLYGQSNKVVDYMLAANFIVAQYEGYYSMINEANCGVFMSGEGLKECFNYALICHPVREKRGARGDARY